MFGWKVFKRLKKLSSLFSPSVQIKKMSSIYLNHTHGFIFYIFCIKILSFHLIHKDQRRWTCRLWGFWRYRYWWWNDGDDVDWLDWVCYTMYVNKFNPCSFPEKEKPHKCLITEPFYAHLAGILLKKRNTYFVTIAIRKKRYYFQQTIIWK